MIVEIDTDRDRVPSGTTSHATAIARTVLGLLLKQIHDSVDGYYESLYGNPISGCLFFEIYEHGCGSIKGGVTIRRSPFSFCKPAIQLAGSAMPCSQFADCFRLCSDACRRCERSAERAGHDWEMHRPQVPPTGTMKTRITSGTHVNHTSSRDHLVCRAAIRHVDVAGEPRRLKQSKSKEASVSKPTSRISSNRETCQ